MAAFLGSLCAGATYVVTAPMSAVYLALQGATCVCSSVSVMACLFQSATGKRTGVSPQAAKLFYILLLGMVTIVSVILRFNSEGFDFGAFRHVECHDDNRYCKGDLAVLRISFVLSLFFALMLVLSFAQEGIHRGYWGIKLFILIGGIIGAFFIPVENFDASAYTWCARIASTAFLVLQILILIDFAYQWNENWVNRAYNDSGEGGNQNWIIAILSTAGGLYTLCIVGIVILFIYYAKCTEGIVFTILSILSIIAMTVLSVFRDKIVELESMQGAILPAAVVSAYVVFLCWSALESNSDESCKPALAQKTLDITFGSLWASVTLMWTTFSVTSNAGHLVKGEALESVTEQADGHGGGPIVHDVEEPMLESEEDLDDSPVYSNEQPWVFHLILFCASMYLAMLQTDWGTVNGSTNGSMWMKIVAQWLTTLLFLWTLVAPAILKDRDWDF